MNLGVALDIGIGLILMYLLISLLVTAINEFIAQAFKLRAKNLRSALRAMLDLKLSAEDNKNLELFNTLQASPILQIAGGVAKRNGPLPSYIDRNTFLAGLRDSIQGLKLSVAGKAMADVTEEQNIKKLIEALPPESSLRKSLLAVIGDVGGQLNEAEKRLGDWFDGMMERATGVYTRWMSRISLALGFALAIAVNADTVHVASELLTNGTLRDAVGQIAEQYVKSCTKEDGAFDRSKAGCSNPKENWGQLKMLPIGWEGETASGNPVWYWITKALGLAATAAAVSLGAPFWFDLLSKFMNVRSSLKKEEKPTVTAAK